MGKVKVLDDVLINQIAAGEVVERPASVVKELVENSIDADAHEITILVNQGGASLIEVIDDGAGMDKDDALVAIERHGTSKITNVDDLLAIGTHGFRGEAIPSIASISRFTLATRARDLTDKDGVIVEIVGGVLKNVTAQPLAAGTRIRVEQLFYNVPARKRFLRSDKTEVALIKSQIQDFAAAYPYLRLRLLADGQEIFEVQPEPDFRKRLEQLKIAGKENFFVSQKIERDGKQFAVSGILSQPQACVASSARLRLLVNGRSVRDRVVLRAVRDGFGAMIKPSQYPAGLINLKIEAADVDVNVHPQKAEVRFRVPDMIYQLVVRGVGNALSEQGNVISHSDKLPLENFAAARSDHRSFGGWSGQASEREQPVFFAGQGGNTRVEQATMFSATYESQPEVVENLAIAEPAAEFVLPEKAAVPKTLDVGTMRFVGQVFSCYLIFEGGDEVVIVDMHAAHERVTFSRLKEQFQAGRVETQKLLIPEEIIVDDQDSESWANARETVKRLGFEFAEEHNKIVVCGVPALLKGQDVSTLFDGLLALPFWQNWSALLDRQVDEIIARLACFGSVRSGRVLQRDEAYQLLNDLADVSFGNYCPHGRPIIKFFKHSDFEKMFGRIL